MKLRFQLIQLSPIRIIGLDPHGDGDFTEFRVKKQLFLCCGSMQREKPPENREVTRCDEGNFENISGRAVFAAPCNLTGEAGQQPIQIGLLGENRQPP